MSSFLVHCNSAPDRLLQPWQQVADVEAHIVHWIAHELQAGIKEVGFEKPAATQMVWKCQQQIRCPSGRLGPFYQGGTS